MIELPTWAVVVYLVIYLVLLVVAGAAWGRAAWLQRELESRTRAWNRNIRNLMRRYDEDRR